MKLTKKQMDNNQVTNCKKYQRIAILKGFRRETWLSERRPQNSTRETTIS